MAARTRAGEPGAAAAPTGKDDDVEGISRRREESETDKGKGREEDGRGSDEGKRDREGASGGSAGSDRMKGRVRGRGLPSTPHRSTTTALRQHHEHHPARPHQHHAPLSPSPLSPSLLSPPRDPRRKGDGGVKGKRRGSTTDNGAVISSRLIVWGRGGWRRDVTVVLRAWRC